MRKFLLFLLLCYSITTPAYAWCEFGGIIDSFTKLHKKCGDYARSLNIDQSSQSDAYCSCRIRIDNLQKYGHEQMWENEFRYYPGLRSINPQA